MRIDPTPYYRWQRRRPDSQKWKKHHRLDVPKCVHDAYRENPGLAEVATKAWVWRRLVWLLLPCDVAYEIINTPRVEELN